jgi:hypothetical protein
MLRRSSIGAIALAAVLLLTTAAGAQTPAESLYPDFSGQWSRIGPNRWETGGQKAPLTAEYRAIYDANLARQAAGRQGDMRSWACIPQGMPMMMSFYDPAEIVVTPKTTYVLISHVNDSYRRIYTDGRDWPAEDEFEPSYAGYSIGKWLDEDGDGRYDVLEVETRHLKGPRTYDGSGLPLHHDNQSIINERIYIDKADRNILHDDITVHDHALTQPWSVSKKAGRNPNPHPLWRSAVCSEDNTLVRLQNDAYYVRPDDGHLMPTYKDQPPPDLKYFNQSGK